nr:hypothetical protein [uncultured Massilia sp.]
MKKLHKPSGYTIETSVIYYEDIRKHSPGIVIINPEGMKTNRIAPTPTMYNDEEEAEQVSFEYGKQVLSDHLAKRDTLYFDQQ